MANLNTLMIKAIKEFNKQHKGCEIMIIEPLEASGKGSRYSEATFGISYIDGFGEDRDCEIDVVA